MKHLGACGLAEQSRIVFSDGGWQLLAMDPNIVKPDQIAYRHTDLPLAVGFGVRDVSDLQALLGKVEVAALCSQYIEWQRDEGSVAAAEKMAVLLTQAHCKAS